jgi:hypothetical protein
MPKYLIYVPQIFDDVYEVEAESARDAQTKWEDGEVNYEDHFLCSTESSEAGLDIHIEESTDD